MPQMPSKYRSRTDVIARILQAANDHGEDISKTRLVYSTFLSFTQLKEYLAILIQNGLLEYWEGTQTYRITEKGLKFLNVYEQMREELAATAETRLPEVQK